MREGRVPSIQRPLFHPPPQRARGREGGGGGEGGIASALSSRPAEIAPRDRPGPFNFRGHVYRHERNLRFYEDSIRDSPLALISITAWASFKGGAFISRVIGPFRGSRILAARPGLQQILY